VIHVHNFTQCLALLRARCPRAKLILHMHCDWLKDFERAPFERRLREVDLILAPSCYTADGIRRRFPALAERVRVLANGVDLDTWSVACDRERRRGRRHRLIFVGRISPEKGLHVLLDALEVLNARRSDWELAIHGGPGLLPFNYIVGSSSDPLVQGLGKYYPRGPRARLGSLRDRSGQAYCRDLMSLHAESLGDRLLWQGHQPHADLPAAYAEADLIVCASVCMESFGMPLAEAMVAGLPIVTTDAGGITEAQAAP
jgi:glycosyltransferase involved in cell wall biosynthesis